MKPVQLDKKVQANNFKRLITIRLQNRMEGGDAAKKIVLEAFQKDGFNESLYRLGWLGGTGKALWCANYGKFLLEALNGGSFRNAIEILRVNRRDWYPSRSTSPYANELNQERYDALREILDDVDFDEEDWKLLDLAD